MASRSFEPDELIVVQTEGGARVCLAFGAESLRLVSDNQLIYLGIEHSLPVLRKSLGRRRYIVQEQRIERSAELVKVILDLDLS